MNRLPPISPAMGDTVCQMITDQIGYQVDIILIVFPVEGSNPQPQFITSYPSEVMESVIRQLGEHLTSSHVASRVIDGR